MKKFIWFFVGLLTIAISYGAFQSGIITGTQFCIGSTCLNDLSIVAKSLPGRIIISNNSNFTGIKQAFDWINASGTQAYEVIIDAGDRNISDTITINTAYPITVRGLGQISTKLFAASGLAGKPMFDILSPVDFLNLSVDASSLAGYGANSGEDGFKINIAGYSFEFNTIGIYNFNKGIYIAANSEVRFLNSFIANSVAHGIYISGGDFRSSTSNYDNDLSNITTFAGSGNVFITEHDMYTISSGQVGITYFPLTYTNPKHYVIINDNFVIAPGGTALSGFDFTLARDADIDVYGNIGIEDYGPVAKILVIANTTGQAYTAGVWTKLFYSITSSSASKRSITSGGRITFLPDRTKSVQMFVSMSLLTSTQSSDLVFAIFKNGSTTGFQYGRMNITLDQNARTFSLSTNALMDSVTKNDYFEIYIQPVGAAETITVQNINWLITSK